MKLINSPKRCGFQSHNTKVEITTEGLLIPQCNHFEMNYPCACTNGEEFPAQCPLQNGIPELSQSLVKMVKKELKRKNKEKCIHYNAVLDVQCFCKDQNKSECIGVNCGYYTEY